MSARRESMRGVSGIELVIGEEELLAERAVQAAVDEARAAEPGIEVRRVPVAGLVAADLAGHLSPSLFADARAVVLEGAHDANKETADVIVDYVRQPADGLLLVIVHNAGPKAKPIVEEARKAGANVRLCGRVSRPTEREAFVRDEVRRAGGRINSTAVSALIDSVGTDLRELASAASQLVADAGGSIDEAAVRRYHRGKAEVNGFAVAEKAVTGDRAAALEALQWAMQLGVPHVLVADALADAVRTVARVSAVGGSSAERLAAQLGMPPWKVRRALSQARGWRPAGLADAMAVVAEVNADVKGVAADPDYALQRAVLRICAAKGR